MHLTACRRPLAPPPSTPRPAPAGHFPRHCRRKTGSWPVPHRPANCERPAWSHGRRARPQPAVKAATQTKSHALQTSIFMVRKTHPASVLVINQRFLGKDSQAAHSYSRTNRLTVAAFNSRRLQQPPEYFYSRDRSGGRSDPPASWMTIMAVWMGMARRCRHVLNSPPFSDNLLTPQDRHPSIYRPACN